MLQMCSLTFKQLCQSASGKKKNPKLESVFKNYEMSHLEPTHLSVKHQLSFLLIVSPLLKSIHKRQPCVTDLIKDWIKMTQLNICCQHTAPQRRCHSETEVNCSYDSENIF